MDHIGVNTSTGLGLGTVHAVALRRRPLLSSFFVFGDR
jgi:hypothetical protein